MPLWLYCWLCDDLKDKGAKLKISQRSLGTADETERTDLTQQIRCVRNQLKHRLSRASTESKQTQPHHTEEAHLKLQMGLLYRR